MLNFKKMTHMTNYISFIIVFFTLLLFSCKQSNSDNFTLDPTIKTDVNEHIKSYENISLEEIILIYANEMNAEFYENDELIFSTIDEQKYTIFKSFYLWQGDTLIIDGAYGLFGGLGFVIKIINNEVTLYHMLSSDDFPSYAYNEKDSLIFRLEVPCTETKIILSEIPDTINQQIIYGYVEFESENYFSSTGSVNGKENFPRKKQRVNMKIYFKSGFLYL